MDERRKNERYPLDRYLGVYDQKTGVLLGCLVDLNTKGFQISGKVKFLVGNIYKCRIDLHKELKDTRWLHLEVKNSWCKVDDDSVSVNAGFEFQNVDQETKENIALLLGNSTFRGILANQA